MDKELLRKFVRYELELDEQTKKVIDEFTDSECDEVVYLVTLDDLMAVIEKIEATKEPYDQFFRNWQEPISRRTMFKALGVAEAAGALVKGQKIFGLPRNEEDIFAQISKVLPKFYPKELYAEVQRPAYEVVNTPYLKDLKNYFDENKNKPIPEWEYPDNIKLEFIREMENYFETNIPCSDDEIELFKRYIQEMADKGNIDAKRTLAANYYGGSKAFPCDWNKARELYEALFEETGDPYCANYLGFIYYYGRCTNGVPEEEKALRAFSYGCAAGIEESAYKLSDLIRNGIGIKQSTDVAFNLIRNRYADARKAFEADIYTNKMADLALRMASFADEVNANDDIDAYMTPYDVYGYYLEAKLAIEKRMNKISYYGDELIQERVQEGLDRLKKELEFNKEASVVHHEPTILDSFLDDAKILGITFDKLKDGEYRLAIRKVAKEELTRKLGSFLVTLPEHDYCKLLKIVTIYMENAEVTIEPEYGKEYLISDVESVFEDYSYRFMSGYEPVAEFICEEWAYRIAEE